MRNYQLLDATSAEKDNVFKLSTKEENPEQPLLSISREGAFVSISASFGPLEIALRPRYSELTRQLTSLQPVPGLATTRQVGTMNSYVAFGLTKDGRLVLRPTIVADARGHLTFNFIISAEAYQAMQDWLGMDENSEA
jgi:hypothetical protein